MATEEHKGFMAGGMKFGVGDDVSGDVESRGALLPLRVLVVADLVPGDEFNAGASAPESALRASADRFDELFTKLRPRIAVEVPSVLAEGRPVRVDLAPQSLKSFRPDGLCAELPLLRSLLDGRLVLDRVRDGSLGEDRARAELDRLWGGSPFVREVLGLLPEGAAPAGKQAAPAPAPEAGSSALDSILDMVDVAAPVAASPLRAAPEPARPAPAVMPSKYSELIAGVARSARGNAGRGLRPTEAIARVEKALGAQIGIILQHPEVRRLEQAWRGLSFLVERAKSHSGIRIDVVSARPGDAAQAMKRAIRAGAGSEPPVSFAIVDVTVDGSASSFTRLEDIASAAEDAAMPVIVNGSANLLGISALSAIERLDNKGALFEAKDRAPWRAAAAKPAMRWVAIAMNGVLSRAPYTKSTSRVREAAIHELPDDDSGLVWMAPAWAVASLAVGSFRDTGWPCRIVGLRSGGTVENLPVREIRGAYEGDETVAVPTEAFLSTESQRDLAKSGVLLLASAPNSDAAIVMHATTAYVPPPKRTYDSASTEPEVRLERVSLGDQLFVARLAQFLRALASKIPAASAPSEVQPVFEAAVWALFENAAPSGPEISVRATRAAGGTAVEVTVRPRRFLGVSLEEISLEVPLG